MHNPKKRTYDPLDYLPRKRLRAFAKGSVIYSGNCESLYLVCMGRVKVSQVAADGYETTIRIVPSEGLFGECSLIDVDKSGRAVPLDPAQLMAWSRAEIEHQIE